MALLERVATLVRANLNDLIDRAENPEKMVKQVMLDMQNQFMQVKTQVAISIADLHLLEKKKKALLQHVSQNGEEIWREHHEVIAQWRGREAGVKAAEAFVHLVRDTRDGRLPDT